MKLKIAVFSGAGISAESGIKTFRDSNGLWEEYDINEVATPQAWKKNFRLVLEFYNKRRKQIIEAQPNDAHYALASLEKHHEVNIITQNIDDLHERAGSKNILHLHGEIRKSKSTLDRSLIYDIEGWELKEGDKCERGSQLRPHVVWFGEEVPEIPNAARIISESDILLIIGTSLNVYPAAGLIYYTKPGAEIYLVGPESEPIYNIENLTVLKENAGSGVRKVVNKILMASN
jgi:NAD-dependent deacetylase